MAHNENYEGMKDVPKELKKWPISLIIITLNEAENIKRCIQSAPFVNEIIVLDSGSQDATVDIAKSLGAKVIHQPWLGYAKQKIKATELATNDWILSLDADEALSEELQNELLEMLTAAGDIQKLSVEAYACPRITYYLGRWMKHAGMYPDYQTRFFHRKKARWSDSQVHEHIIADNRLYLKNKILHWSFTDLATQVQTINKYSALRAVDFKNKGKKFSLFKLMIKPASKFFEVYIVKQGFLEGVPGLIASYMSAFSTAMRWAKLYELEKAKKLSDSK